VIARACVDQVVTNHYVTTCAERRLVDEEVIELVGTLLAPRSHVATRTTTWSVSGYPPVKGSNLRQ
jgi:hypothetical protein